MKEWTKSDHEDGQWGLNPFRALSEWGLKKCCLGENKRGQRLTQASGLGNKSAYTK